MNNQQIDLDVDLDVAYKDWRRKAKDTEDFMSRQSEFRFAGRLDLFEEKYELLYQTEMEAFRRFTFLRDGIKSIK